MGRCDSEGAPVGAPGGRGVSPASGREERMVRMKAGIALRGDQGLSPNPGSNLGVVVEAATSRPRANLAARAGIAPRPGCCFAAGTKERYAERGAQNERLRYRRQEIGTAEEAQQVAVRCPYTMTDCCQLDEH